MYLQVYIMPPMSRNTPYWYRRYFPNIMSAFRTSFKTCEEGLVVLPIFKDPVFEKDYIHLNEDSGPAWAFLTYLLWHHDVFKDYFPCPTGFYFCLRYICHLIEQCCQCEESAFDKRTESAMNMHDAISSSILVKLQNVEEDLSELTVRQAEEQDGRINEG